jgi:predicted MPP superfamily phosphohydrolase
MFSGTKVNFYLGMFLTAFVSKLFLALFLFLQDGPRLLIGFVNWVRSLFGAELTSYVPSRRKAITGIALGLASIPFLSMLYGVTKGKYRYTINRLSLSFKNLPAAFDGFKIVQISDIHAGSLDNPDEILKGVKMINELQPDTVLFTGDMVNSDKDELNPFIDIFSQISSKEGNFAVLGNHDYYGLYDLPESNKEGYWEDFYSKFKAIGFDLLNNTNRTITRGDSTIKIVGVENWGAGRWFPKEGDLDLALAKVESDDFCVLMSHDPTHWEEKVLYHNKHIDLTLSGHTHGFQFGINMPGFKWSPAQYRYKRWIGLHEEKNQKLYINKGFGFLAFPGRVGMWPEITLIELKTA